MVGIEKGAVRQGDHLRNEVCIRVAWVQKQNCHPNESPDWRQWIRTQQTLHHILLGQLQFEVSRADVNPGRCNWSFEVIDSPEFVWGMSEAISVPDSDGWTHEGEPRDQ